MDYKNMSMFSLMKLLKRCRTKGQIKFHLRRWKAANKEYLDKLKY